MTAFAAVMSRDRVPLDVTDVSRVAAALGEIYGTPANLVIRDGCALATAPLDAASESRVPFVDPASDVAVVGHIMIEGAADLARTLAMRADVSPLALASGAYSAWPDSWTRRLSGEFAAVLWDPHARQLVAARDGLGVRLLYVADGPGVIVVTNVLDAALAHPGISDDLDDEAIVSFLATSVPGPGRTAFRAIRTLPPGHTLSVTEGGARVSMVRHWWFPHPQRSRRRRRQDAEITDEYRATLQRAVADRTRGADASILLSGGIDSTTIAAAFRAAARDSRLHAVTAVYRRLTPHDEIAYARRAADSLGIPLQAVDGDAHEALDALWRGAPTPQPIDEPWLSDWRSLVGSAAEGARIGLSGEDGDSLFFPPGLRGLARSMGVRRLSREVLRYVSSTRRMPYLGIRLRERLHLTPPNSQPFRVPFLSPAARRLLERRQPPGVLGCVPEPLPVHPTRPVTQTRLAVGAAQFLAPLIAPELTRHRIALCCPLLDTRVIQFVIDLPAIPWCQNTRLPREAFRGQLDDALLSRPKTAVGGLDQILVAAWQRSRDSSVGIAQPSVEQWIDRDTWRRALHGTDADAVVLAWRVLQLDAWMTRRDDQSRAIPVVSIGAVKEP
jgi:asparagine synthase (glutamine-hydrolysing)